MKNFIKYSKKRAKSYFVLGLLLGIIACIKNIFIIFIIPLSILLWKKKRLNKILIPFLVGFFLLYMPYLQIQNISLEENGLELYNHFKNNIIDTNLGSIKVIEEIEVLDNFEEKNYFILKENSESAKLTVTNKEFYEGKKALQLKIKAPTKEEIILQRKINPSNWNRYNYFNLWIKNKDELGWFGVYLIDEDGDWWNYDNDQILKKQEWTLLKIPLAPLKNYGWTEKSNRRMDNIIEYRLKFHSYPYKSNYESFIDYIYLSKF